MSAKSLIKSGATTPSVFEDFFKPWNEWFENGGSFLGRTVNVPAVNITESNDKYSVSLAAPGMQKSDFQIGVEGNMLTISSEKEESREEKEEKYTRKEYSYNSFSRSFSLPEEVNQDKIEATYTDGVLNITLPKKEEAKRAALSKNIAVK